MFVRSEGRKTERQYICIDLKSYYASVECVSRGLDPFNANLVVADITRTEKTICLAVSPALKSFGIPGRIRLFEVNEKINVVNALRKLKLKGGEFNGKSCFLDELNSDKSKEVSFIVAPPRMRLYMETSAKIYDIYLRHIAPEDIHVYSVDEVFIDVTHYLKSQKTTPRQLAQKLINDVFSETGITATVGIGTNMYLAKVAMDIVAKKMPADENGVRIAELDEQSYRCELWDHTPITDFWRVGRGYANRLRRLGIFTMGDIAECSHICEDVLYKEFGVNAELLIDHAWGYEPCTIEDIREYRPMSSSISTGQVLKEPYDYEKARLIVKEMTELLSLDLVKKGVMTKQITLNIGYDRENLDDAERRKNYKGEIITDIYGRKIPKWGHGTENLKNSTSSTRLLMAATDRLFERITDKNLLVRRITIAACNVTYENADEEVSEQMDIFTDYVALKRENERLKEEKNMQKTIIKLKNKYGKNAVIKGMNLQKGGTTVERNGQVGGHRA